jgi:hypothetical protein
VTDIPWPVRLPTRGQRAGLGLAVTDDAGHDEIGVVERGAMGVREGVAELAALVDRARGLGRDVAGHAVRERELAEQVLHPGRVPGHAGDISL